MALETGDYISDLNPTNPTGTDPKSQGDDHLRLIKKTLQATFPNADKAYDLDAFRTDADPVPADDLEYPTTPAEDDASVVPLAKQFAPFDVRRYGAITDDLVDDTDAFEDALKAAANKGRVFVPSGVWLADATSEFGLLVYGEGLSTLLNGTLTLSQDATGNNTVEVVGLIARNGTNPVVLVENPTPADVLLHIERLYVQDGVSAVLIRNNGKLIGTVAHVRAENLTGRGVNVGWNDITSSANWGPVLLFDIVAQNIYTPDSTAHYGVISYVPHSRIIGNHVRNIGNATGADAEGIYTKARHSVLSANVLVDCMGEGFMNLKGTIPGAVSDGPEGFGLVASGNLFLSTDDWKAANPGRGTGVKLANENIVFSDAYFEGIANSAIITSGSGADYRSLSVADVLIEKSGSLNFVIQHATNGKYHTFRGLTIRDAPQGVRVLSQNTDSNVSFENFVIETTGAIGMTLQPAASPGGVLSVRLINGRFFGMNPGVASVRLNDSRLRLFEMIDCDLGQKDFTTGGNAFFSQSAGASPLAMAIRGTTFRIKTTDGTLQSVFTVPVPTDAIAVVTCRAMARLNTGAKQLVVEKRGTFYNNAGTATLIGSVETLHTANVGSPAWTLDLTTSGGSVLTRPRGAAAENVEWSFEMTVNTPGLSL